MLEDATLAALHWPLAGLLFAWVLLAFFHLPRLSRALASAGLVIGLALTALSLTVHHYSGRGLDEAFLYHLYAGMAGLEPRFLARLTALVAGSLLLTGLVAGLANLPHLRRIPRHAPATGLAAFGAPAMTLLSVALHPAVTQGRALLEDHYQASVPPVSRYLVDPDVAPPSRPRSFVLIYAEGLEGTYFDERRFPGLVPGLSGLAARSLNFTNLRQAPMTGWTMAGMVASQCGLPLAALRSGTNLMVASDSFLPGATCIGDILARDGYRLSYIGGASLAFAGKGKFYRDHGFTRVLGKDELVQGADGAPALSEWGLHDGQMFELALEEYRKLLGGQHPFGLVLLTLDTHAPHGHPSRECIARGTGYSRQDSRMLDAVACSDLLLGRFIRRLRAMPASRETLVVVLSDHLVMSNDAGLVAQDVSRRNLMMVLDPLRPARVVDRAGTALDVAPTLLQLLGYEARPFGLGRSLLAREPTLAEQLAPDQLDNYLRAWRKDLWRYWFPGRGVPGRE